MSRKITVEGLARAVRYLEHAFQRYGCAMAEALKKAGGNVAFVGQFLLDLWESKLLPERLERNCAVCGKVTGHGPLDSNPRTNAVYCSNKCRQKAYRQRQSARYGKKARNERTNITKVENVSEGLLETLRNRNNGNSEMVCAWCDVYNRVECVTYDGTKHAALIADAAN
jgi:hypothetical protein